MVSEQQVTFYDAHDVLLEEGEYKVTVTQKITHGKETIAKGAPTKLSFELGKPHHRLEPHEVVSVYPPAGSNGDYQNTMPHIILSNSTLPWQVKSKGKAPWIALLVLDNSELAHAGSIDSELVREEAPQGTKGGMLNLSVSFFHQLFGLSGSPEQNENRFYKTIANLTHVRQTIDKGASQERACLLANRLPQPGSSSVVYAVSIANLPEYCFQSDDLKRRIILPSLFNFRFQTTIETDATFDHLKAINAAYLHTCFSKNVPDTIARLQGEAYLPLSHHLRNGAESHSLYRGPLVPKATSISIPHVRNSDGLLRKNKDTGWWDTSYAAAWNIGRSMAMSSTVARKALISWQRENRQESKATQVEDDLQHQELIDLIRPNNPPLEGDNDKLEHKSVLEQVLHGWMRVVDLPFQYLIPDRRMIPLESIRFFTLDEAWFKAFINGAFSIATLNQPDEHLHDEHWTDLWDKAKMEWNNKIPFGLILHSDIVEHFPELYIVGKKEKKTISPWQRTTVGRLCFVLFSEQPDQIEIAKSLGIMHAELNNLQQREPILNATTRVIDINNLMKEQVATSAGTLASKIMRSGSGIILETSR